MTAEAPSYLILGELRREYIISSTGRTFIDQAGGNTLYAASGLRIWGETPGLVSRVGSDYPLDWLKDFQAYGLNTDGIQATDNPIDLRSFIAYQPDFTSSTDDPVGHFADLGQPFPKSLLSYINSDCTKDDRKSRSAISPLITKLPENYQYASAAHLCPIDFLSHSLLPPTLSNLGLTTITLDPGHKYMHADAWEDAVSILPGLTALHISESAIRSLFEKRTQDLWEMAEIFSHYDCPIIVIKRGALGQLLYIKDSAHKYQIPAYPTNLVDPSGAGHAFCGGFLAGYKATFDPLQAVLYGNVSASLIIEGSGPFYGLESLPGLAQARLETLPEYVQII